MEDLISLVKILSAQKVKQIEIITEEASLSPKTRELYNSIREGIVKTDEDAAMLLYQTGENDSAYRKLKYRLKQRLINTLFFIDVQEYSRSEYQKAHGKAMKNWAAFKILLDKGVKSTAINLAENILKSTIKNDLLELTLLILKDLKFQYGLYYDNKYKYEKFSKQYYEIKNLYNLKEEAEELYVKFARIIINTKNYKFDDEIKILKERLEKILDNKHISNSYYAYFYSLEASYLLNIITRDLDEQLKITEKALHFFSNKNRFSKLAIFSFTEKKGISLLGKNKLNEALICFNDCLKHLPTKGKISWHNLQNYLFITFILKKDYSSAYNTLCLVLNNKGFKKLSEVFRQPWYLKEAFIQFLVKIGKIDPSQSDARPLRAFRLSRFMNEVSFFAKDKRGLNITINIIQMLFLIIDEKYDDVLDKLTALRQYNFRYLKRPEYNRSRNFIKMLLKIPEGDYKALTIRKKADKHYKALLNNPSTFSEHDLSLEIIPYEQLWEEILSIFPE